MQLTGDAESKIPSPGTKVIGHPALTLVTLIPLLWLLAVTGTAAVQKMFHPHPAIGFLSKAAQLRDGPLADAKNAMAKASAGNDSAAAAVAGKQAKAISRQVRNFYLNATVTGFFLTLVVGIFLMSTREWILLAARRRIALLRETEPTWLPEYAVAEARPRHAASIVALALALVREISGEAKIDRLEQQCICNESRARDESVTREQAYVRAAEERFEGINRCC